MFWPLLIGVNCHRFADAISLEVACTTKLQFCNFKQPRTFLTGDSPWLLLRYTHRNEIFKIRSQLAGTDVLILWVTHCTTIKTHRKEGQRFGSQEDINERVHAVGGVNTLQKPIMENTRKMTHFIAAGCLHYSLCPSSTSATVATSAASWGPTTASTGPTSDAPSAGRSSTAASSRWPT